MSSEHRAYVAACMAVIAGSVGYMLCDFGAWPKLIYLPYEHEWRVATQPPSPSAMVYPGMLLWGFAGALVGAASSLLVTARVRRPLSSSGLLLLGGWAAAVFALSTLYFLWSLWPF